MSVNLDEAERIMKSPGPIMPLAEAIRLAKERGLLHPGFEYELPKVSADNVQIGEPLV